MERLAQEDMLICKNLATRTTAEDICNLIDSYFKKQNISSNLYRQVCTDEAKVMLGEFNSVVTRMKQKILT